MSPSRKVTTEYSKMTIYDDLGDGRMGYLTSPRELYIKCNNDSTTKMVDAYGMLLPTKKNICFAREISGRVYYFNELTDTWYDIIERYDEVYSGGTWYMYDKFVYIVCGQYIYLFTVDEYIVEEIIPLECQYYWEQMQIKKNGFNEFDASRYRFFGLIRVCVDGHIDNIFQQAHEVSDIRRLKILMTKPQKICAWPNDVQVVCGR